MKSSFFLGDLWDDLAAEHKPELGFKNAGLPFDEWRKTALAKLVELLGPTPEPVPLDPVTESSVDEGDFVRERVILHTDRHTLLPCVVFTPKTATARAPAPAILCSHGHGPFGKNSVAGVRNSPEAIRDIESQNYDFAVQMAREGFVTLAPDLRGFGERRDPFDPIPGRDLCNVNFIKGALFGIYPMTLNIFDFKRCIDYLETKPEADGGRIGMMGLSQGGTMTTFTTAVEPRIKACDIIGYVNPFAGFAVRDGNFCGSQIVPGIYRYFDTFDIAGLIAPRPCLMEMGRRDDCFPFEGLLRGWEETKAIYAAAGVPDMPEADIHDGGHAYSGVRAPAFFKKYL
ncbi:MAG: dienelactone hydrolase family protein [Clostridia bacterium]|nr:dienelactone hydrolase family protein [Clostridia bacterium]